MEKATRPGSSETTGPVVALVGPAPAQHPYLPVGRVGWDNAFGDTALLPAARALRVKGNLVRSRSRYIRERWGEAMVDEVARSLTGAPRDYLVAPPLATAWCDYGALVELDAAITAGPMRGDVTEMKAFGYAIAAYDITSVYRFLFKLSSPGRILQLIGLAWGLYFTPGKVVGQVVGDGESRMRLTEGVLGRYLCEFGISGWMEATVAMSEGVGPVCEHVACQHRGDPACEWRTTWRSKS